MYFRYNKTKKYVREREREKRERERERGGGGGRGVSVNAAIQNSDENRGVFN